MHKHTMFEYAILILLCIVVVKSQVPKPQYTVAIYDPQFKTLIQGVKDITVDTNEIINQIKETNQHLQTIEESNAAIQTSNAAIQESSAETASDLSPVGPILTVLNEINTVADTISTTVDTISGVVNTISLFTQGAQYEEDQAQTALLERIANALEGGAFRRKVLETIAETTFSINTPVTNGISFDALACESVLGEGPINCDEFVMGELNQELVEIVPDFFLEHDEL